MEMMSYILPPLICAAIGWLTNHLAVKMLFRPQIPVGLGPIKIQGVFPKRQEALAQRLGALVEEELLCGEDILSMLDDERFSGHCREAITTAVDRFVGEKLVAIHPMAGAFLGGELGERVQGMLAEEMEAFIPTLAEGARCQLGEISVGNMVQEKVAALSLDKLENLLMSLMQKEFRFIELIGAILGCIIGIGQVLVLNLL